MTVNFDAQFRAAQERAGKSNHHQRRPNGQSNDWPSPDWSLLDDRRGTLPEFPLDVFGDHCREWLVGAARGAGVMPDHVATPLLAISSCLVGAARRIRPSRAWSEPLALWTSVMGFSGTGKTPGLNVVTRALSALERAQREKIGELRRAHERKAEVAKAAAKKWKAEVTEAIDSGLSPPEMPPEALEIGEFVAPRLYCSDVTIERLAVLLQARPNGINVVCDELAGLFLNMGRYSSGGTDREFWLKAWNGCDHVVERQGRPPVVLDHLLVSITGGFQPEKLAKSFAGDDDGMYARCLFSWPLEPAYERLSNDHAEIEPEFQNALARLAAVSADAAGTFAPKSVWLADDAVGEFEHFRQFLHEVRNAYDGREREWLAKGPGQVLRLAGTLSMLDWAMAPPVAEPDQIDLAHVRASIRLWREYFLPHARAALRQIGLTDRHATARRLMRWVKANDRRTIAVLDARRDALAHKLDAEQTQDLIDALVKSGWLRDATETTGDRGRPARRWEVNPALWKQPDP